MACTQSLSGLVRDCAANVGGVKNVYIANYDDVATLTIDADANEITAITMQNSAKFKKYYFKRGQASVASTPQYNEAGDYAGENSVLSLTFLRQDATKRLEVAALSVGELAVIYEDNNGQYWYLGNDRPVLRTGGESGSGAANTDNNRYGIELTAYDNALPLSVDSAIISNIVD